MSDADARPAANGKGEETLFEMKLSKEEKKALMAAKKAERDAKKKGGRGGADTGADGDECDGAADDAAGKPAAADAAEGLDGLTAAQLRVAASRNATAVLTSQRGSRDAQFAAFSLQIGGRTLVNDCVLELCQGCRYGLIGENGSGKSNVLAAIAQREVPLPLEHDVFHLHEEAAGTEQTAVEVRAALRDRARPSASASPGSARAGSVSDACASGLGGVRVVARRGVRELTRARPCPPPRIPSPGLPSLAPPRLPPRALASPSRARWVTDSGRARASRRWWAT
jgi:hypothetical protein